MANKEKRLYRSKPGKLWYGWNRMKGMFAKRDRVMEEFGEAAKTGGMTGLGVGLLYFTGGIPFVNLLTVPVGLVAAGVMGFRTYKNLKEAAYNPAVNSYVAGKEREWKNSGAPYKPGIGLRALYGVRKAIGWGVTATKGLFTAASFGAAGAGLATIGSAAVAAITGGGTQLGIVAFTTASKIATSVGLGTAAMASIPAAPWVIFGAAMAASAAAGYFGVKYGVKGAKSTWRSLKNTLAMDYPKPNESLAKGLGIDKAMDGIKRGIGAKKPSSGPKDYDSELDYFNRIAKRDKSKQADQKPAPQQRLNPPRLGA